MCNNNNNNNFLLIDIIPITTLIQFCNNLTHIATATASRLVYIYIYLYIYKEIFEVEEQKNNIIKFPSGN